MARRREPVSKAIKRNLDERFDAIPHMHHRRGFDPIRRGRGNKLDPKVWDVIFERIAQGDLLINICKEPGMPAESTARNTLHKDKELYQKWLLAKQLCMDKYAEEIIEIADNDELDVRTRYTRSGRKYHELNLDNVKRSELQIKTRQFLMSTVSRGMYGDIRNVQVTGKDGGPIEAIHIVELPSNSRPIKQIETTAKIIQDTIDAEFADVDSDNNEE